MFRVTDDMVRVAWETFLAEEAKDLGEIKALMRQALTAVSAMVRDCPYDCGHSTCPVHGLTPFDRALLDAWRRGDIEGHGRLLAQRLAQERAGVGPCAEGCSDPEAHAEGAHDV